ncbi:hypothetical protein I7007_001285 [Campylobacter jejuni]|nr:hypothetical protein [Campylobacter jejuni]EAJ2975630.1 hypothetical protein [Campylobacter jejuni]EDP2897567.1 hypothetical protein [Campylobacter jejuni]EGR9265302.1 hypothetical protein [Campylobacter jejuni]KAJ9816208.1 hypothetical protein QR412_06170 [Campylobacter jejuni]QDQ36502.1 hypothetical protein E5V15_09450 [Campylobacter jejuni]
MKFLNNKKIIMSIAMISVFSSQIFAANTEDFFYQRGYENGYNKGFEAGVKKAFEEAKNVLVKYKEQLTAYEVGKYLITSRYLTYPEVWQEKTEDGAFKLRVTPSKIERPLDVDELFTKFSNIPITDGIQTPSLELTPEEKNSVYLSNRDSNANDMPQNVDEDIKTTTLSINKTAKNLDVLKKANVVFSDEGNAYNVLFFTPQEKKDFCKSYKICE